MPPHDNAAHKAPRAAAGIPDHEPRPPIEFVDGPGSDYVDEGEALDTGPGRSLRGWWASAALVVLAATTVLLVRHRSSDPAPVAAPSTAVRAVTTPTPSFRDIEVIGPGSLQVRDPSTCPARIPCVVEGDVTVALSSALLDALPGAHIVSLRTVRTVATGKLWFRQVVVIAGRIRVLIEISQSTSRLPQTTAQTTDTMTFVREVVDGLLMQVRADGPSDGLPSTDQLFALSEDDRLRQPA